MDRLRAYILVHQAKLREQQWRVALELARVKEAEMVEKVKGLARLMGVLNKINEDSDKLADEFMHVAGGLQESLSATQNNIGHMKEAKASLDAINQAFGGNGGPPLGDSSPPPATPPPPPAAPETQQSASTPQSSPAHRFDITAMGPVKR